MHHLNTEADVDVIGVRWKSRPATSENTFSPNDYRSGIEIHLFLRQFPGGFWARPLLSGFLQYKLLEL